MNAASRPLSPPETQEVAMTEPSTGYLKYAGSGICETARTDRGIPIKVDLWLALHAAAA